MEDALMLFNSIVAPMSFISNRETFDPFDPNLIFFSGDEITDQNIPGRLKRFKIGNTSYIAIFNSDNGFFRGYYSEKKFWENNDSVNKMKNVTSATYQNLGETFSFLPLLPIPEETKVFFCVRFIIRDTNTRLFSLVYNLGHKKLKDLQGNDSILDSDIVEPFADNVLIENELSDYGNYIIDKLSLRPDGSLAPLNVTEEEVLFDIILILNEIWSNSYFKDYLIAKGFYEPFSAHINLPERYAVPDGQVDQPYHNLYNEEFFSLFRLKLIDFRYWLLQYRDDFNKIDPNDLVVYMVNIFPPEELSYLTYETKINLLAKILQDNYWIIGNWYFNKLNEEEAIVKIIQSIAHEDDQGNLNYTEIDKFMDFLNSNYLGDVKNDTYFEILYDKLNDTILYNDDGKGNRARMVKAIYNLWVESKFNPHHSISSIANTALSYFNYTSYTAITDALINFPHDLDNHVDKTASPMLIGYESEKVLLWYADNFSFNFDNHKIEAKQEFDEYQPLPIGYYNIFQPVAIKATDLNDTIIKMPVHGIADVNDPTNVNFINNCIPIFYLKYVDDLGDYSDAKQTIGTVIDVALTFTGVGNLAKLRHIKDLSLLRKVNILGELTLSAEEKIALYRSIGGIVASAEVLFGAASFFHNLATDSCTVYYNNAPPDENSPEYQQYLFCQSIDKWLFAFEIASMSADLLARRALRKASKELALTIPASVPASARQAVDEMADLNVWLNNFLDSIENTHQNVHAAINALSTEKKYAFVADFENSFDILDQLDAEADLIQYWNEIEKVPHIRKNIGTLKAYKRFVEKPWEIEHITDLIYHTDFKPKGGHINDIITSGDAKIFLNGNPPTTSTIINGHIKYKNLYFLRPSQFTSGGIEVPVGSGLFYYIKEKHYIINPTWNDLQNQRIREEMAHAFSHAILSEPSRITNATNGQSINKITSIYKSYFTDGTEIEFKLANYQTDPVTQTLKYDHLAIMKIK